MHPAFANIEFGPFKTAYHRAAIDSGLKEAFFMFLETCLLPRPGQPLIFEAAQLVARYNEDKYCGPNSAIRDWYVFDCTFNLAEGQKEHLPPTRSPVEPEIIDTGIFARQKYNGPNSQFMNFFCSPQTDPEHLRSHVVGIDMKTRTVSTGLPFFFWPVTRMQRHREQWPVIEQLCRNLIKREVTGGICPVCLRELQIAESPTTFNVRCPMNCFECRFDPQLKTGKFLHGHFAERDTLEIT